MSGTVFAEFAPLYDAAAQRGFSPQQVDEMEVWQLASVLGLARPPEDGKQDSGDKRDLIAERVKAAKGLGPRPAPRPQAEGVAAMKRMAKGD